MELRINDYVRTDTGIIEKIEGIHEQNKTNETIIKLNKMGGGRYAHILDINSEFAKSFDKDFSRGNIIKSSPNIIDLIEEGDYVNGIKIDKILMRNSNEICYTYLYADEKYDVYTLKEIDIKSIVTKEAFASMEYKIGD